MQDVSDPIIEQLTRMIQSLNPYTSFTQDVLDVPAH